MSAQHTPGPWTLTTVPTSSGICHKIGPFPWRPERQSHACVYVDYPGNGPVEAELLANARLIAAAPGLLEALEKICEGDSMAGRESWTHADVVQEHYAIARAAIAKAKGPAQ